jgi:hypothetical protein
MILQERLTSVTNDLKLQLEWQRRTSSEAHASFVQAHEHLAKLSRDSSQHLTHLLAQKSASTTSQATQVDMPNAVKPDDNLIPSPSANNTQASTEACLLLSMQASNQACLRLCARQHLLAARALQRMLAVHLVRAWSGLCEGTWKCRRRRCLLRRASVRLRLTLLAVALGGFASVARSMV